MHDRFAHSLPLPLSSYLPRCAYPGFPRLFFLHYLPARGFWRKISGWADGAPDGRGHVFFFRLVGQLVVCVYSVWSCTSRRSTWHSSLLPSITDEWSRVHVHVVELHRIASWLSRCRSEDGAGRRKLRKWKNRTSELGAAGKKARLTDGDGARHGSMEAQKHTV
ncbi:uncharacterized protein K452DRAFT_139752 [Aplosporella prunicola CBS 121167]|uniref:Uncharacterized protein n=1 Tax=Aplosporella prunicola CBS 121167 TaxID=1176127 RepID=A0A6A6AWU8_9PEZI|nr:uncharacterized protein K452DRAFT_139752 [Aplosporella prunicola CBS 121167]KAF2136210.1 hypothetical protein K452DRAFT_139752 [Aplosporella prunicola CBS 121167]